MAVTGLCSESYDPTVRIQRTTEGPDLINVLPEALRRAMRRIDKKPTVLVSLIVALVISANGFGQGTTMLPSTVAQPSTNFTPLPVPLRPLASALGNRLLAPGKERRTLIGTLTQAGQTYPCTLVQELPNKFRIDKGGSAPATIAFDGHIAWASYGNLTEKDQDILESLFDDTPEILLVSVLHGGAIRLLINHGRMDDGSSHTYTGPFVTVYQLVAPAVSRTDQRQKQFYFDSATRLPILTRYRIKRSDGQTALIETSSGNWTTVGAEFTPSSIKRVEDGKDAFVFQTNSASYEPSATDGIFTKK